MKSKNKKVVSLQEVRGKEKSFFNLDDQTSRVEMIQMLIPLGLQAVEDLLLWEVKQLAGKKYERGFSGLRWGSNPGSVYLGDQKVHAKIPRVRDKKSGYEIPLTSYQQLQNPHLMERMSFARVLGGLSQARYEEAALTIPETFGIKRSSVSRKFIRATSRQLKKLLERDLSQEKIVAIFLDGKWLGDHNLIIAIGVRLNGSKIVLGFIEAASENSSICKDFLKDLIKRGLKTDQEILFIVDGSKGFHKAIEELFGEKGFIQRCQWHKRENVLKYLPEKDQDYFRGKLQGAYESGSYEEAKKKLNQIRSELKWINESAVRSLEEGLEETLTLHRLGVFKELGESLKTTNIAESINSRVEADTKRVTYWKNSNQRQRWVGAILLEVEPKLRKLKGYRHLPKLREAMKKEVQQKQPLEKKAA